MQLHSDSSAPHALTNNASPSSSPSTPSPKRTSIVWWKPKPTHTMSRSSKTTAPSLQYFNSTEMDSQETLLNSNDSVLRRGMAKLSMIKGGGVWKGSQHNVKVILRLFKMDPYNILKKYTEKVSIQTTSTDKESFETSPRVKIYRSYP